MLAKEALEFLVEAKKIMNNSEEIVVVENNDYSISVKVNYVLKTEIRKRAKENGMTISAFVRYTLTNQFIENEENE